MRVGFGVLLVQLCSSPAVAFDFGTLKSRYRALYRRAHLQYVVRQLWHLHAKLFQAAFRACRQPVNKYLRIRLCRIRVCLRNCLTRTDELVCLRRYRSRVSRK